RAHLEAHHDLPRLAGLVCLDARGPRYAPDAFARALAVGMRADPAAVEKALERGLGAGAARLMEEYRARCALPMPRTAAVKDDDLESDELAVPATPGD